MLGEAVLRAQRLRDRLHHQRRVAQRSQPDPEDPGLEVRHQLGGDVEREARLAGAARARERQEARAVPQQTEQLLPFPLSTDEGGDRPRQVRVRDRLQWREALAPELEQRDRLVEVLQPVLAELGEVAVDERPCRGRHDDLSAVPGGGDAGSPVELPAGIALAGQKRLPRVQAHPYPDRSALERLLPPSGRREGLSGVPEGVQEGVALRVDLDAAGESAPQKPSPWVSTSTPPWAEKALRRKRRCSARARTYPSSPSSSISRVEPSMSVNRRVTVPLGSSISRRPSAFDVAGGSVGTLAQDATRSSSDQRTDPVPASVRVEAWEGLGTRGPCSHARRFVQLASTGTDRGARVPAHILFTTGRHTWAWRC